MRLVQIKDSSNLGTFKDAVALQIVDGNVEAIVLTVNGETLRITAGGSYSNTLKLLVEEPKDETTMFRVGGEYMGLSVDKTFTQKYDADNYLSEMVGKLPYGESHSLQVESFTVLTDKTKI